MPPPYGHGFVFSQWTTADGLPQGTINDILQTEDGRLWLATFGGLVRFDGKSFDVLDVATLPALGSNQVLEVEAAPAGGVWVATTGDTIVRIERDSIVERIPNPAAFRGPIGRMAARRDGEIWLESSDRIQIWRDGQWESVGAEEGLEGRVVSMAGTPGNGMYVATSVGVYQMTDERLVAVDTSAWLEEARIRDLYEDGRGRLWIGSNVGLAVLDEAQGRVRPVTPKGSTHGFGTVTAIGPGKEDELWVGGHWGLAHLHLGTEGYDVALMYDHPSISARPISVLTRDGRGNVWIGTAGAGLARLAPQRIWRLGEEDGLPSRDVFHIAEDGKGGVWVGGTTCLGAARVQGTTVTRVDASQGTLADDCVSAVNRDHRGGVWFGHGGSISRLQDSSRIRTWTIGDHTGRRPYVGPIVNAPDGTVWFGFGRGRLGYVRDTSLILVEPTAAHSPVSINSMVFDTQGQLWLGHSGEVSRISLTDGHIDSVRVFGAPDGVPPGTIRVIHASRTGDIWIGSYGGGIARCGPCGERFNRITTEQGLADNSVSAIVEDERERFWILGNRGISVVKKAVVDSVIDGARSRLDAVLLGRADGMPEGNGGWPAAVIDANGIGWFASIDGLVGIDTRAFPRDTTPPIPQIEAIRLNGAPWTGDGPIVAEHGATEVGFHIASSGAASMAQTLFRYRLEGQDADWVYADAPGDVRYPRVPPGIYRFLVEARNEDGVWSRAPASVDFRVQPLWWQQRTIQWGAGLLVFGLIGMVVLRRVQTVEARNLALSQAIEARDRAEERARRQQRELEHVARIATAGELATSLAHELNQPLTAIVSNAAAGDALLSNPDIGKEAVREALDEIVSEGQRASRVIKGLREFLSRGSIEKEILDFNQVVEDVLVILEAELREAGIDVATVLADDLPPSKRIRSAAAGPGQRGAQSIDAMRGRAPSDWYRTRARTRGPARPSGTRGPGFPLRLCRMFEPFVTTKHRHGRRTRDQPPSWGTRRENRCQEPSRWRCRHRFGFRAEPVTAGAVDSTAEEDGSVSDRERGSRTGIPRCSSWMTTRPCGSRWPVSSVRRAWPSRHSALRRISSNRRTATAPAASFSISGCRRWTGSSSRRR